ncbi:MAG TPA: HAD-IA family hydrolase [Actinomycetota bacterium]
MRFHAVFFDVGETLVHPVPSFPELFAMVLAERGYDRDGSDVAAASAVVRRRFSDAARTDDRWTLSPERSRAFWVEVYREMLETLGLPSQDGLRVALYERFTQLSSYALFDDVAETLDRLDQVVSTLGIVSNFEAWLDVLLDALDVRDRFDVRVISGLEGVEKPDPAIYRLALERAGVEPECVVFVGDNPEFDVDPPARLGMVPVLIDRHHRYPEHEGHRIDDLRSLPSLLETL